MRQPDGEPAETLDDVTAKVGAVLADDVDVELSRDQLLQHRHRT